jgi:hypothetical protein
MNFPDEAIELCADEKTLIQELAGLQPLLSVCLGQTAGSTFKNKSLPLSTSQ